MNAPCPACGAQLHYLHDDIGRTISCRQCGARLEVDSGGLHATGGGGHRGMATAVAAPAEVLPAVAANPGAHFTPRAAEARPAWMDIASWVFLLGLLIVLPAVFVPMIMRSGLQRLEGRMIEGQIPVNQKRHEIDALRRKKEDDPKLKERSDKVAERRKDLDKRRNDAQAEMNKAASDEAFRAAQAKMEKVMQDDEPLRKDEEDLRIDKDKARTAAEKELSKENDDLAKKERDWLTERDKLDDERQKSQASALWWSPIFMSILAFGSIVLAVGALGLLGPRQTVARRVVGAVTLGLLVLLLFNKLGGGRNPLSLASAATGGDYDFSTPESAVTAEWKMQMNGDFEAYFVRESLVEGPRLRERIESFHVHKTVMENGYTFLFASYHEKGNDRREVYGMKVENETGTWVWDRNSAFEVALSNLLRKEIEDWRRFGEPEEKSPIPPQ